MPLLQKQDEYPRQTQGKLDLENYAWNLWEKGSGIPEGDGPIVWEALNGGSRGL